MNKKTISFKVANFIIYLHRGQESSKEMEQKRMALLVSCLCYIAMQPMAKYFEKYCPEIQSDIINILLKNMNKKNK